jgi:hypothetical protein
MKTLLLAACICITVTATAQRVPPMNDLQQRLRKLELTVEQKRRIMMLIQRERMQYYKNQKELNQILTPKQRALLRQWRNSRDSTNKKPAL